MAYGVVGVGNNISYKPRWQSPHLPSPTILASGPLKEGDNGWLLMGEYEDSEVGEMSHEGKPEYKVPSMREIEELPWNGFKVVSTFSGTGGSCLGYRMAGYKVVWANEFIPAAQECYKANHPSSILDTRDIRTVDPLDILNATGLKVGELDLFDGSPPCFAAGTQILTRRGLIGIEDVREGDMVVTHLGRWRRVTGTSSREADIIAVRGHGHPGIKTTKEHPFYVRHVTSKYNAKTKGYCRSFSSPEWKEIGECLPNGKSGNKLSSYFWGFHSRYPEDVIPRILKSDSRSKDIELTPEIFWIVGLWLGDGWLRTGRTHIGTSSRGEVLICAGKHEADMVRINLTASGLPFSEAEQRTTIRFTICHKGLAEWLEEDFSRGAKNKTVPYWAFGMKREFREHLLDGYLFADGTFPREGMQRSTSVSWSLTVGMAMLARTLGKATGIRTRIQKENATIEGRTVNLSGASYCVDYFDRPRSFVVEDDYCWGAIKEINPLGKGTVYNIHVEEDESYVADGIIVHNCSAFSTAGKREKGWGKEKNYSDGATQVVDDLFFEYVRILKVLQPKVFIAENVSGLVKGTAKGYFKLILQALKECGYVVEARLCDAQWLGVPQVRQRIIFMGVREDLALKPAYPNPLPYRYSVREVLPNIEGYMSSGYMNHWKSADEPYGTVMADGGKLSPTAYLSTNGYIMDDKKQHRKFTIPELKRICSFPDDFILEGNFAQQWERMGRSVPPVMMSHIAASVRDNILRKL